MAAHPEQEHPEQIEHPEQVEQVEQASHALMAISVQSLAVLEGKVSMAQLRALLALEERGSLNVGGLADVLTTGLSTASRMADRLVAAGLVDRRNPPHSRREIVLTLTPAARKLLRSIAARRRALIAEVMQDMPEQAREALLVGLSTFADVAGRDRETDQRRVVG